MENRKNLKFNNEKIEKILISYKEIRSSHKVAELLSISQPTVLRYIKKYLPDLLKRNQFSTLNNDRRKYTLDETYFDNIDTANKAYILGFLYADGYNSERLGQIKIVIHKKDIDILHFIKNEIKSNFDIKYIKDHVKLCLNSKKISKILSTIGCHQNKTFSVSFPYWMEKNLQSHFIRGYFDGDGCIHNRIKDNSSTVSFIGYLPFMNELNVHFENELNVQIYKPFVYKNPLVASIKFGNNMTITKIKDYLYNNADFFLKRKRDKFDFYQPKERKSKFNKDEVYQLYIREKSTYKVAKLLNTNHVSIGNILKKYFPGTITKV